jgi:predicted phage terminase large subunit-like protein
MTDGKHLVLDAWAKRCEPRDFVSDIINKASLWGVARVFIESVAQQKGFIQFVQSAATRRGQRIAIEELKPGGRAKDVRIEGLSVYFKSGQLLVHKNQFDLLDEYRKYRPGARLVDLLDALAYAPEHWPRVGGRGQEDC